MMIETQPQTRKIVRAYFNAWTRGDVHAAEQYFADDLAFIGTLRVLNGAAEYVVALKDFRKLITTGVDLLSELYGENEAALLYNAHTVAGDMRIAEHIRLIDSKIASINVILDPTALLAFKAAAGQ